MTDGSGVHFDLTTAPWIPCVTARGDTLEMSLTAVFCQAQSLRAITADSPLEIAALYRLLLAIVTRVHPIATPAEWGALWSRNAFDTQALAGYCARWRSHFDLFDEAHPFLQTLEPGGVKRSATQIIFHYASGVNTTLWDQHTDDRSIALAPAAAARALLAFQAFSLAGTAGTCQLTDAPWSRGIVGLVQGSTLFETLMLNLLPGYLLPDSLAGAPEDNLPFWERPDPWAPRHNDLPAWLDYLTFPSQRVLLHPAHAGDQVVVRETERTQGLRLPGPDVWQDPMKFRHVLPNRGTLPIRPDAERPLWRSLAASLDPTDRDHMPPVSFAWLHDLIHAGQLDPRHPVRLLATGMTNDQAKVIGFAYETWPLPLTYFETPHLGMRLGASVYTAGQVSNQLWGAASTLVKALLSRNTDKPTLTNSEAQLRDALRVKDNFWTALRQPFRELLTSLPAAPDASVERWHAAVARAARTAFRRAITSLGAGDRAAQARVIAASQFDAGLAKALSTRTSAAAAIAAQA